MPSNRQGEISEQDVCPATVLMRYESAEEDEEGFFGQEKTPISFKEILGLEKTPGTFNDSAERLNEESKVPDASPKEQRISVD